MNILCITGLIGSGKDAAARYLEQRHGFFLIDYSQLMGTMLEERGLPPVREEKRKLRLERGNTFVAEEVVKQLRATPREHVVLNSLRRPEDFEVVKEQFPQAKLVVIDADEKVRFERTMKRERDRPKDWDDFLAFEKIEEEVYHFTRTFTHVDFRVPNNGTLEDLYHQLDEVVNVLKSQGK